VLLGSWSRRSVRPTRAVPPVSPRTASVVTADAWPTTQVNGFVSRTADSDGGAAGSGDHGHDEAGSEELTLTVRGRSRVAGGTLAPFDPQDAATRTRTLSPDRQGRLVFAVAGADGAEPIDLRTDTTLTDGRWWLGGGLTGTWTRSSPSTGRSTMPR
jgi:hypothetical protein